MKKCISLSSLLFLCFLYNHAQQSASNFIEKNVVIQSKGCSIEGSLLSSGINNAKQKIAIIIAGSGPTDRNGNSPLGIAANSYKMLAEELAKQHIATYRYDKRGIVKSIPQNFNESALSFDDYVNDAATIFDYLKDSLGYKNIYFIGHSEGSLIGMIASAKRATSGYISLSGISRTIDVVIEEQVKKQPDSIKNKIDSIFAILKLGHTVDAVPQYLYSLFRPSVQPYMISWLKYLPGVEIAKLQCPILILQGTCDIQVTVGDAEGLHHANTNSKMDIIPSMTHTLKNAGENCNDSDRKTYKDGSLPLNTILVSDIVSFINGK